MNVESVEKNVEENGDYEQRNAVTDYSVTFAKVL